MIRYTMAFAVLLLSGYLFPNLATAQFYVRGGFGFGMNANQDAYAIPALERNSSGTITAQKTVFGSFGQGARISLAGGYFFTPNIGVELEFYYFMGFAQPYGSDIETDGDYYQRTGSSNQFRVLPSLVLQLDKGKFRPFMRFGVLVPLAGQVYLKEQWEYENGGSRYRQRNIDGKFSVGFESSVGVNYQLNDKLVLYAQVTYTGLRVRSLKASTVKDESISAGGNVTDNTDGAFTILTEIEFQDEMTRSSNYNTLIGGTDQVPEDFIVKINGDLDVDRPINLPTQSSNFNALSLSLGVKYDF